MRSSPLLGSILSVLLLGACASRVDVISTDLTRQQGAYVVGYVDRPEIRAELEDRFVADLTAQGMRAIASRADIPDIRRSSPAEIVRAANAHEVAAIVVINRVRQDGSGGIVQGDRRITPDDADLQAYYEATRDELDGYQHGEPVFAQVNAFLVDGQKTRRFWTGTSWAFDEGDPSSVVAGISQTIAAEMAKARDEVRSYDRPMD